MKPRIAILCAHDNSTYFQLSQEFELDIYTKDRDCLTFKYDCPVIAHPPCAQWSKCRGFAYTKEAEKNLAWFCLDAVNKCGGIFEHPAGSAFFPISGTKPTICVNQSWWGFPAPKRTYLYFNQCKPLPHPLSFNITPSRVEMLHSSQRSLSPIGFNRWLIESALLVYHTAHNSEAIKGNERSISL